MSHTHPPPSALASQLPFSQSYRKSARRLLPVWSGRGLAQNSRVVKMRRIIAILTVYVFLFGFLQASPVGDPPKHKSFLRHLFGPSGVIFSGISTSIQHARNAPMEWGSGLAGLGLRYASAFRHNLLNAIVPFCLVNALTCD